MDPYSLFSGIRRRRPRPTSLGGSEAIGGTSTTTVLPRPESPGPTPARPIYLSTIRDTNNISLERLNKRESLFGEERGRR